MADSNSVAVVVPAVDDRLICGGAADIDPPTISVVSPTPDGPIRPLEAFVIDITDPEGISLSVITCQMGGVHEVVWLRNAFSDDYLAGSSREAITDGWRYTIRRDGGWVASPTFNVEAVDLGGNFGV